MKLPSLIQIFFIIPLMTTSLWSAERTIDRGLLWGRFIFDGKVTDWGLNISLLAGSRYNYVQATRTDSSSTVVASMGAWRQELSAGIGWSGMPVNNMRIAALVAYTPEFWHVDEVGGPFFVMHNIDLYVNISYTLGRVTPFYRIFFTQTFPAMRGSTHIPNSVINRQQLGLMFHITPHFDIIVDDEIFLRLTPSASEQVFWQNVAGLTFRIKPVRDLFVDVKYYYVYANTAAWPDTIYSHDNYLALWVILHVDFTKMKGV